MNRELFHCRIKSQTIARKSLEVYAPPWQNWAGGGQAEKNGPV